jgi:hypothetical protein
VSNNINLQRAKNTKNDEFYTQYADVEKECDNYTHHFIGKVVYCNCDDPTYSAFWRYFHLNFTRLGLKKLISTHYSLSQSTYKMEYGGGNDSEIEAGTKTALSGNGDFQSEECIAILKEADIVCTNPPFSLLRSYVSQLTKYEKRFIIIASKNCITFNEVYPLLYANKMWVGAKSMGGSMWFTTPYGFMNKSDKMVDGVKLTEVPCCWFTNLDIPKRHKDLILWKRYTPEEYPKYTNYDAINVDKVSEIPCDYYGVMGVPITFMDKYNPEQFRIIGHLNGGSYVDDEGRHAANGRDMLLVNGKTVYKRLLVRRINNE